MVKNAKLNDDRIPTPTLNLLWHFGINYPIQIHGSARHTMVHRTSMLRNLHQKGVNDREVENTASLSFIMNVPQSRYHSSAEKLG